MLGQTWHEAAGLKDGPDPQCGWKSKVGEGYLCVKAIFCEFKKQDLCLTDSWSVDSRLGTVCARLCVRAHACMCVCMCVCVCVLSSRLLV